MKTRQRGDQVAKRLVNGMSDSTGHTPGPWTIDHQRIGPWGEPVALLGDITISYISWLFPETIDDAENEANARLIASAPALLDILEGFLNTLVTEDPKWEALLKRYYDSNIELFDFAIDTYKYIQNLEEKGA
jgi:hypothetical protein